MNLFKSILTTILVYAVFVTTVCFGVYQIADVYNYANETLAIETQCRDGNFDAAKVYMVEKADDGSYTVEYAGRNLDDLVIKAYYDKDGNYLYTEKETAGYVMSDIFGCVVGAAILSGFAYIIYSMLVALAEACVNLAKKIKEKKAVKVKAVSTESMPDDEHYVQH